MMKSLVIAVLSVASAAAFAPVSVPKVGKKQLWCCTAWGVDEYRPTIPLHWRQIQYENNHHLLTSKSKQALLA
jgi:hypothetical protein